MTAFSVPSVGTRFRSHGSEFEISYVARSQVRYAAVKGGKSFKTYIGEFEKLMSEGVIELIPGTSATLPKEVTGDVMRSYWYVSAALTRLVKPTARLPLQEVIAQVAAEHSDSSPPSRTSVCEWIQAYIENSAQGLRSQYHRCGNRMLRASIAVEQYIEEGIRTLYLSRERHSAIDVRSFVAGKMMEAGLLSSSAYAVPTLRTIQRRIKALDPIAVAHAHHGPEAARRAAAAAGRSIIASGALSLAQIDSHKLDLLVLDPETGEIDGRPWLVSILDVHTRCIIGWHLSLHAPSSVTALAALKDMLSRPTRGLPGGVVSRVLSDLGVEFINDGFSHTCSHFNMHILYAQRRDPNAKGNKERWYGSLETAIVQKLPGTTFSNPQKRGDYKSEKRAIFSLTQVSQFIEQWIEEVYHRTVHTGTGRAPIMLWEEQIAVCPPISISKEDADVIARRPVFRTIQSGRVRCDNIEYFSHALATLQAAGHSQVKVLIDDLNLHTVLIEHPEAPNELILAESTNPDYTTGLTRYMHEEAQRIKKALSDSDRRKLGANADLVAKWRLQLMVQAESKLARKMIAKLTNGKGKSSIQVPRFEGPIDPDPTAAPIFEREIESAPEPRPRRDMFDTFEFDEGDGDD